MNRTLANISTLLFLTGAGIAAGGLAGILHNHTVFTAWPIADAEVVSSRVFPDEAKVKKAYRAEWEFRFTANGKEFLIPIQSPTWATDYASRKIEANRFPPGTHQPIRYSPDNPYAIEMRKEPSKLGFFGTLLWIVTGLAICFAAIRLLRRKIAPRIEMEPASAGLLKAVFLITGSLLVIVGVVVAVNLSRVHSSWPRVEGTVIQSQLQKVRDTRGDFYYFADVEFQYQKDGRKMIARTRHKSGKLGSRNFPEVMRSLEEHSAGSKHWFLLNPEEEGAGRFEAAYNPESYLIPAAVSVLGGIFLIIATLIGRS